MPYRRTLSLCYKRNITKLERTSLSDDVCKGLLYGIYSLYFFQKSKSQLMKYNTIRLLYFNLFSMHYNDVFFHIDIKKCHRTRNMI